jgi:hypothetical protein
VKSIDFQENSAVTIYILQKLVIIVINNLQKEAMCTLVGSKPGFEINSSVSDMTCVSLKISSFIEQPSAVRMKSVRIVRNDRMFSLYSTE